MASLPLKWKYLSLALTFALLIVITNAADPTTTGSSDENAENGNENENDVPKDKFIDWFDGKEYPDSNGFTDSIQYIDDIELEPGEFLYPDPYYERLQDWGAYNYSSEERAVRSSVVKWGGKVYDPLSFQGLLGNWKSDSPFAVAFHLSTEVAVSSAQSRNGTLFDIVMVDGDEEYKRMMAQIQKDLKGNRSEYYAEPDVSVNRYNRGIISYPAYFHRIYRYLRHGRPPPSPTNPYPIFKNILESLVNATQEALRTDLNNSSYVLDLRCVPTSAPWELNHTFDNYMYHALNSLNMTSHPYLTVRPDIEWHNYSNSDFDYSGPKGTEMAFEQARGAVEMIEYDPYYRYGDFTCGTGMLEEEWRVYKEMVENGTWVDPPKKGVFRWECKSWKQCVQGKPWPFGDFWDIDMRVL